MCCNPSFILIRFRVLGLWGGGGVRRGRRREARMGRRASCFTRVANEEALATPVQGAQERVCTFPPCVCVWRCCVCASAQRRASRTQNLVALQARPRKKQTGGAQARRQRVKHTLQRYTHTRRQGGRGAAEGGLAHGSLGSKRGARRGGSKKTARETQTRARHHKIDIQQPPGIHRARTSAKRAGSTNYF